MYLYVDAKATLGMLSRKGVGSLKHVETNAFWLQALVSNKTLILHKIHSDSHYADVLTKYLPGIQADILMMDMGFQPCPLVAHRQ